MARLKTILGKIKDKASLGKATVNYVFRRNTKCLHLSLLKSTTHNSKTVPKDDHVAAVLSYSGDHRYAPAAVAAALWRLRVTRDASVAAKSLIILHNLLKPEHGFSGEIFIKNHHLFDKEGRNILKLDDFRDSSSPLALELSRWVRWYAQYLDGLSSTARVLGYFPINISANYKERAVEKDRVSRYQTGYIIEQTGSLVSIFEHVRERPRNPSSYRNKIADEIRELVSQDYFSVMQLVMVRLQVLNDRLAKPDVDDSCLEKLEPVLARLEVSTERWVEFPWRCKVLFEDFWCVVRELKGKKALRDNKMIVSCKDVNIGEPTGSSEPVGKTSDDPVRFSAWETFDDDDDPVQLSAWETFDDPVQLNGEPLRF